MDYLLSYENNFYLKKNQEKIPFNSTDSTNCKIKILEQKESGSYGKIFKVKLIINNINIIAAIKQIDKNSKYGMNCLMEYYVMIHMSNIYLSKALRIDINNIGSCQIIQPLAISDISEFLKKEKKIKQGRMKKWIWQIICSIANLHSHGILHGDIKCKNILLYDNDNIALTDFGLSKLIINPDLGTKYGTAYTINHKPIEVLTNNSYSYPADIWALGCTLYELKHNISFLTYPSVNNTGSGDIKERYIHFINKHFERMEDLEEKDDLDKLIDNMLKKNEKDRISIWQIIESNYFSEMPKNELPKSKCFPIFKFIDFNGNIVNKYGEYLSLISGGSEKICRIIANKLLNGINDEELTFSELNDEIQVCKNLNFNFYPQSCD